MSSYKITTYIDYPNNDYEHLTQSFKNNDICLNCEYDHSEQIYGLVFTEHIESLTTIEDIAKRLFSIQILLTGARFVELGTETHRRIKFDKFEIKDHDVFSDGFHNVYSDSIEEYPFENTEEENIENPSLRTPCGLDSMLFSLSKIDYVIRSLLFQAGMIRTYQSSDKIFTWSVLYKIVDTVKYGCKNIGIDINDLIESGDLNKFTSACNNSLVLGISARHGLDKKSKIPKKTPITNIEEAVNLILCLSNKFVTKYIKAKRYCKVKDDTNTKCKHKIVKKEDIT